MRFLPESRDQEHDLERREKAVCEKEALLRHSKVFGLG